MTPKEALEVLFNNLDKARLKELSRSDKYGYKYEEVSEAINVLERLEKIVELYRLKDMYMEDYYTYGSLRGSQKALDNLRSVREEIEVLEKELEEMK